MSDIAERALHTRTARSTDALERSFLDNLYYIVGQGLPDASPSALYRALAYTVRERLLARFMAARARDNKASSRTVAYFSAEFLIGPQLGNNLLNLDVWENTWGHMRQALTHLGLDLDEILRQEPEPGLGNGGLGRLAACYMDSLATLEVPAIGYGIRYEFGLFKQEIRDGWQIELADAWLKEGNPWEIPHFDRRYAVGFGGHIETTPQDNGRQRVVWHPETVLYGTAYDTPILGYGVMHVNLLRLWKAEAGEAFNLQAFNHGNYYGAVDAMVAAENITKVLYPNDEPAAGKRLRLQQQYFFVSCSLQDMLRRIVAEDGHVHRFAERYVAQLNDTHPAIAIAELMRLLIDVHGLIWAEAWAITRATFAYTNHTLLPEALEAWPLPLFRSLLPRHLDIIYAINADFLAEVRGRIGDDGARLSQLSIINEAGEKFVRMAHLACVGSFAINGVAKLHSDLLKETVLQPFHALWPEKFSNKTNGVTPRRFMALANPPLDDLIRSNIGNAWLQDLYQLRRLEDFCADPAFLNRWQEVKLEGKKRLADYITRTQGITLDPTSLFDIQAKRIHEYKRQHLNILHVISLYLRLKSDPLTPGPKRSFIFAGKAAPGYFFAKLIIKLINDVADVVNNDSTINGRLKVVFVPNFNTTLGQLLYPAADISEQISLAGMEASGTGNMKFAMNGALTLGTLDGANVEMRDAVGPENFFTFGLDVHAVNALKSSGYRPQDAIAQSPDLQAALKAIAEHRFSAQSDTFTPLLDNLWNHDPYLVCADFESYRQQHIEIAERFMLPDRWARQSILNVARMGEFSSDRAIRDYCREIWNIPLGRQNTPSIDPV